MGKLDDYQSKSPEIIGTTVINHAARKRLALTCSEYAMIDHLTRMKEKSQKADASTIYTHLGFSEEESSILLKNLVLKGFVRLDSNGHALTSKWEEAFPDIEREFDKMFWRPNGVNEWTGSKKKALEYYVRIRKKYSADFLAKQKNDYIEFLRLQKDLRGFDQQRMMCQVFLNPANERFLENYSDYIKQLKVRYAVNTDIEKIKPVTREDILNAYGKTNQK